MIQRFDQLAVGLAGTGRSEPRLRRCRPGTDGRKIRRAVHADELHVPIVNFRAMLRAQLGPDFDRAYLKQSGGEGHEKLNATMDKVQSRPAT